MRDGSGDYSGIGDFPVELVAGNHEHDARGPHHIDDYTASACLPHFADLGSLNVDPEYGKQYYFDYPPLPESPLARIILISPSLRLGGET